MRSAILLTIARDAEIQVRIAQFRRSTNRAFVQWFGFAPRLASKTLAARRDFTTMPRLVNDLRSKKDQIIRECRHQRHAIRHWAEEKSDEQQRSESPGQPFDLHRQDKQNVDHLVGVNPTWMRVSTGIPRNPKRRSSLSSQVIVWQA